MIWSLILMYCIHITVITSKENFRSAYFLSSENKRLPGHVFKQMYSSSFMLCNQACLKHSARCASTNFIKFNEETDEGHCELNEEEPRSSVYDDIKLTDQPGTTFTMFLKNACDKSPCKNGGTCQSGFTGQQYKCLCPLGFASERCEQPVTGVNCRDIKIKGQSWGDGMYWLDPDEGSHSNAFQAYCDMTSYNGGWTMCYTTDEYAKPRTEVKYNATFPYGTDGYRTNCNNIKFIEIMFIDHQTGSKAYFTQRDQTPIKAAGNYGNGGSTYGLWDGVLTDGVGANASSNTHFVYQLLICDHSFFSGFFVSGYTGCYKYCYSWCNDVKSPYFRIATKHP